jgi:hypothetical protein
MCLVLAGIFVTSKLNPVCQFKPIKKLCSGQSDSLWKLLRQLLCRQKCLFKISDFLNKEFKHVTLRIQKQSLENTAARFCLRQLVVL